MEDYNNNHEDEEYDGQGPQYCMDDDDDDEDDGRLDDIKQLPTAMIVSSCRPIRSKESPGIRKTHQDNQIDIHSSLSSPPKVLWSTVQVDSTSSTMKDDSPNEDCKAISIPPSSPELVASCQHQPHISIYVSGDLTVVHEGDENNQKQTTLQKTSDKKVILWLGAAIVLLFLVLTVTIPVLVIHHIGDSGKSPSKNNTTTLEDGHDDDDKEHGTCGKGDIGNGLCADTTLCCSKWGWCGSSIYHCNPLPPPATPNSFCGNGNIGTGLCSNPTMCCSKWGWCGTTHNYCGIGSIATIGSSNLVVAPSTEIVSENNDNSSSSCGNGVRGNGICDQSQLCCSVWGYCGIGSTYCDGDPSRHHRRLRSLSDTINGNHSIIS